MLLSRLEGLVNYWSSDVRTMDKKDAMRGLVHSILVTIDGCAADLPAFSLIANPHPDDEEYHCSVGENYFPKPNIKNDISGGLHEDWARKYCRNS